MLSRAIGKARGTWLGWLLATPLLTIMLIVVIFPFGFLLFISLTEWMPTRGPWWAAPITGVKNFTNALTDVRFYAALIRTIAFVVVAISLETLLGLLLALIISKELKGHRIFNIIFLLPMMIVPAVTGFVFFMLFQTNGPVNEILGNALGLSPVAWLTGSYTALLIAILADVWQWTPMMFLIILAGILAIPKNLVDAAYALGANPFDRFRYVILPLLRPVLTIAVIIRSIEVIKVFDVIFILTRGGPGTSTETISIYIYQLAFREFRMAYAGAISLLTLVLVILIAVPMVRTLKSPNER